MERRFAVFLLLAFGILAANAFLMRKLNPPAEKPQAAQKQADDNAEQAKADRVEPPREKEPERIGPADRVTGKEPTAPADKLATDKLATEEPEVAEEVLPESWPTIGSLDPDSPYRMLVTFTNRGAAVARIELNSPRFHEFEDRSGYMGHVVMDPEVRGKGCPVQVVGPGTPAAKAGLKPGDLITAVNQSKVTGARTLALALKKTKPKHTIKLAVVRGGKQLSLDVTLARRPMEIIRPEADDRLSFLLTLNQIDKEKLPYPEGGDEVIKVGEELDGLDLWNGTWEVAAANASSVKFRRLLPKQGLEITKTYSLAKVPKEAAEDTSYQAYHLVFDVAIRNVGKKKRDVAYQLDGPTGLPIEGWWYANKVGRTWTAGLRDCIVSFDGATPTMVGCPAIAEGDVDPPWSGDQSLTFIGVDAQYFSTVLIPQKKNPADIWFDQSQPLLVGKVDEKNKKVTDTSCRLCSVPVDLEPGGSLAHRFTIFAGPKRPALLAQYKLQELVYYGWFSWIAVPMIKTLHLFYAIFPNYGLAIILLTVLVRSCMYPMSRKQALGAQKMQELQPEIKRIQERYKKDMEGRTKAQQDLFRKHNYNPLSGCLVLFVQLPIFIALYRALMVDVELREATLLGDGIRWCSNLAAPDMLFDWSGFMPEFITCGIGMLGLGPYFNILPILTIVLFIVQQKVLMPPPADEQAAMQQKIMKYMMIFMGVLFFKVASGLCLYFIASSIWGLAERKLLPKSAAKPSSDVAPARPKPRPTNGRGGSGGKHKGRKRK